MKPIFVLTAFAAGATLAVDTAVSPSGQDTLSSMFSPLGAKAHDIEIDSREVSSKAPTKSNPKPNPKPAPKPPTPGSAKTPTKSNLPATTPKGTPKGSAPKASPTPTPVQKGKPSMTTSYTSKSVSASSSPLPSSARACPVRPRKRDIDELDELDSWLGFDPVRNKRMRYVVLG